MKFWFGAVRMIVKASQTTYEGYDSHNQKVDQILIVWSAPPSGRHFWFPSRSIFKVFPDILQASQIIMVVNLGHTRQWLLGIFTNT